MKVCIKDAYNDALYEFAEGSVRDLDDDLALDLIERGFAEPVKATAERAVKRPKAKAVKE